MIKVFTYDETERPGKTVEMTVHGALGELMGYLHVSRGVTGRRLSVDATGEPLIGLHDDDPESDGRITFSGSPGEMQPLLNAVGALILMYGLRTHNTKGGITFVDNEYVLPLICGADIVAMATLSGLGYDFDDAFELGVRMKEHPAKDVITAHDMAKDANMSLADILPLL